MLGKDKLLYLHHLAAIANALMTVKTGRLLYYYSRLGLVELTNPCLAALYILGRLDMKNSSAMTLSGGLLFLGFLILRVINGPLVLLSSIQGLASLS